MERQKLLGEFLDLIWSRGEVSACDRFIAERYTIHHDPGDPWEGKTLTREEFKDRVRLSRAPFPDQRFAIQQQFEADGAIAVTWLWSGTHLGDMAGFPATGRVLTMSGATSYTFDSADRLCGHWQVTDRLGIFRQLQNG